MSDTIRKATDLVARDDYTAFAEHTLAMIAAGAGLSYEELAGRLTPLPEITVTLHNPAPACSWVRTAFMRTADAGLAQNPPSPIDQDGK